MMPLLHVSVLVFSVSIMSPEMSILRISDLGVILDPWIYSSPVHRVVDPSIREVVLGDVLDVVLLDT